MRYDYAGPYKTRTRAEQVLEDMFATGDASESEFPKIEDRSGRTRIGAPWKARFVISLGDRN